MNLEQLLATLITALIVTAVPIIVKKGLDLANAKIDELQKKSHNAQLNAYIDKAQSAVSIAVTSVSQTYVDNIKKGGNALSKEEQEEAFKKAYEKAKTLITNDGKKAITEVYGDFDTYIEAAIENYVKLYRD